MTNLVPIRFRKDLSYPAIEWLDSENLGLTEPFFEASIRSAKATAITPLDTLLKLDKLLNLDYTSSPPLLIFQVSRCGSTLVSQMLKSVSSLAVISEPNILNHLILMMAKKQPSEIPRVIRSYVGALNVAYPERKIVIKCSSWNACFLPLFIQAFPKAPLALLIRNPIEVLVSIDNHRPQWSPSKLKTLMRINDTKEDFSHPDIISRILEEMQSVGVSRKLVIDYEQLPDAVWNELLEFWNIKATREEIIRMRHSSTLYSKSNPSKQIEFKSDVNLKKQSANPSIIEVSNARLNRPYQMLLRSRSYLN